MDEARFDTLARSIGVGSRRTWLQLLAGSVVGGLVAQNRVTDSLARKRKKKKKCKAGTRKCGKKCIAPGSCCSADECGAGGACVDGICFCGAGLQLCRGKCISANACCDVNDCDPGKVCLSNGSCATVCTFPGGAECNMVCSGCSFPSAEGPSHCTGIAQPGGNCASTAECPRGQHCQHTESSTGPLKCIPLCAS